MVKNGWRRGGVTLVELIIAMALLSLAMLLFHSLTQTWARKAHKTEVALDLQSEALKALRWFNGEFAETTEDAVLDQTDTADPGITFVSPRDVNGQVRVDSSGRLLWQRYMCLYTDVYEGEPVLMLKVRPIATPTGEVPARLPVLDFKTDASLPARVVARNVTLFQGEPDPANPTIPWNITIETRAKSGPDELGVRVETSVFFRN